MSPACLKVQVKYYVIIDTAMSDLLLLVPADASIKEPGSFISSCSMEFYNKH